MWLRPCDAGLSGGRAAAIGWVALLHLQEARHWRRSRRMPPPVRLLRAAAALAAAVRRRRCTAQ
eukprot:1142938-Pyramimonas_sp.AAC.1